MTSEKHYERKTVLYVAIITVVAGLVGAFINGLFTVDAAHIAAGAALQDKSSSAAPTPSGKPPPKSNATTPPSAKFDNSRGWGPARRTFTMNNPAPYPVFNSITNMSHIGDERNFVQCHDTQNNDWEDTLVAYDGHTYECYLGYDNDVSPSLDDPLYPGSTFGNLAAQLQDAQVAVLLPNSTEYNPGITGQLSADNSISVWDSCNFLSTHQMTITYIPDSARMYTNATPKSGTPLVARNTNDTAAAGMHLALVGFLGDKQDGNLRQNAGYILFDIKISLAAT